MVKLNSISIGLLKSRENCMQNHCITQKWWSSVMLVELPSLVLTFLKTIFDVLWLNSDHYTEIISLCLNYHEKVCLSNVYGFSKMERRSTQPEHQWTCFTLSLVTASFLGLLTHLGPLSPLICLFVIIFGDDTLRRVCMSISPIHWRIWKKLFAWKLAKSTEQCRRERGGQLPRTPSEMHQWKQTSHEGYCFPNLNLWNAKSMWTQ